MKKTQEEKFFKELLVTKNCLRPQSAPVKRERGV